MNVSENNVKLKYLPTLCASRGKLHCDFDFKDSYAGSAVERDFKQGADLKSFLKICRGKGEEKSTDLNIIYTTDIHGAMTPMPTKDGGQIGGVSYMAGVINEFKKEGNYILVDAGDWGQGTMESNLSHGKVMTNVMNELHYDAIEIGNHEFDWGRQAFDDIIKEAKVPVLCSNIVTEKGELLPGVRPYVIKEVDGVKVGIVGTIADDLPDGVDPKNIAGLKFLDSVETTKKYIDEIKGQGADLILVLSHEIDSDDERLAKEADGIIIIGGHSHNNKIDAVNNSLIIKAGTQCKQVGHLRLNIKTEHGQKTVSYENELIVVDVNKVGNPDREIEKIIEPSVKKAESERIKIVGSTDITLTHDRLKLEESPMADFLTDAIRLSTGSDIAVQSSSGVRDQIFKGKITCGDLYRAFPFDNQVVCIDITGKQLSNIMETSAGQTKDYLQVSGMTLDIDTRKPSGQRVSNIKVNGISLDNDRTYRIAINDLLLTGAFGYKEFKEGKNIEYHKLQRDTLLDYIMKNPVVKELPQAGRLNFIK